MSLEGRVAIVTGSGGGLGRAHVRYLASKGARVVVNDLSQEAADRVAAEVVAEGGSALAIAGSVTDEPAMAAMVARVVDEWGRVDVLVNNAGSSWGTTFKRGTLFELEGSDFDGIFSTNVKSQFYCGKAVAPIGGPK